MVVMMVGRLPRRALVERAQQGQAQGAVRQDVDEEVDHVAVRRHHDQVADGLGVGSGIVDLSRRLPRGPAIGGAGEIGRPLEEHVQLGIRGRGSSCGGPAAAARAFARTRSRVIATPSMRRGPLRSQPRSRPRPLRLRQRLRQGEVAQTVPDGVGEGRVGRVGGERVLVVEHLAVGVDDQRDRRPPADAAIGGAVDQHRVGPETAVGAVGLERQSHEVGGAVRREADPGSEARAKRPSPPLQSVVPGTSTFVQVLPPSLLYAETSPLAPPLDQRSCCQPAIRFILGLAGLTSTQGSISVLG